jgi:HK97 gp10 family phage protein
MALKLSIDNPEALTAAIDALETVASESVLRQATVAGARVIFDEVKHRAPVGDGTYERKGTQITPGFLRDNILIAYDKERSAEGLRATYLITWSKDAFYGRFLEYGHWSGQPIKRCGCRRSHSCARRTTRRGRRRPMRSPP